MWERKIAWVLFIGILGFNGNSYAQNGSAQLPLTQSSGTIWRPIAIGAGGQLTGIDIAPDGTKVVKADAFGAYIWNPTTRRWDQLITALSWGEMASLGASGVWEIRIAPSQTTRLYMIVNGYTYRSDNRGGTWIRTSLGRIGNSKGPQSADANGPYKFANQKMAVDPSNPDVVYVGTITDGVWRSFDAGKTWTQVKDIPTSASEPGSAGIAFDPNSGTIKGRTKTIFVPSYGRGVWQSTDAGATWKQIADGTESPLNIWTAQIGADGVYWCSEHTHVWKYSRAQWSEVFDQAHHPMEAVRAVATDPNQPGRVIFVTDSANRGWETLDNGASLVGTEWFLNYPKDHGSHAPTDIPWLKNSDTSYMTLGDAKFDPTQPNKLYFAEGIGIWWTNWPHTFSGSTYYSQSAGIEELVANDIVAPPGGKSLLGVWDRGVFRVDQPDEYPSRYYLTDGTFTAGWALDYASADPRFVVALNNWPGNFKSGYSSDSGQTWNLFRSQPDNRHQGGSIAAATHLNIVVVPGNNGGPIHTKDGGNSWLPLTQSGSAGHLPNDGWIFAFYLHSHIIAADRVNIGTFYLYNYLHGVYRTTDGGDNWSLVHAGEIANNSGFNARLRSTPDHAGHLWYTSGPGPITTGQLMRSTDGGESWHVVFGTQNIIDFGFGKAKSPGAYPTIFIAGKVHGEYGIWRSDDEAASWVKIGDHPNNNVDQIKAINGDLNTFGTSYVGFSGSGFSYGTLDHH